MRRERMDIGNICRRAPRVGVANKKESVRLLLETQKKESIVLAAPRFKNKTESLRRKWEMKKKEMSGEGRERVRRKKGSRNLTFSNKQHADERS